MMSILLATAAAVSGTTFECRADSAYLSVFAPSAEVTQGYRGNVLTLYEVTGDGEILAPDRNIEQVFDALPDSLYIKITATEFDVELEISNYDPEQATSLISITATTSRGGIQTVQGKCSTAAPVDESDAL